MKPVTLAILIAVVAIPVIVLAAVKKFDKKSTPTAKEVLTSPTATPASINTSTPVSSFTVNPSAPADAVSAHKVTLSTSKGDINLTLFPDETPLAVQNFVTLGKRGYYDNIIFHRVIKGFMDQTGDPTGTGTGGESIFGRYFKTELTDRKFLKGVVGGARTSAMDTNGSQFFIMAQDYPSLNGQYTAFGQVSDSASQAVVDAINAVATNPSTDKPLEDVKITGFKIVEE